LDRKFRGFGNGSFQWQVAIRSVHAAMSMHFPHILRGGVTRSRDVH